MSGSMTARILKAMAMFSGVQSVGIICSIVRTKLISLWIGPAGVGLIAIYNSAIELISNATQLNMRQSAVRDISASGERRLPFIAGVVRWWSRRLGLAGMLLMALLSPALSFFSFGDLSHWWCFAVLSVTLYAMSLTNGEQALMQGSGRLAQLAHVGVRGAVISTAICIPLYYLLGINSIIPTLIIFAVVTLLVTLHRVDIGSQRNTRAENVKAGADFIRLGIYLTISTVAMSLTSYAFVSYINNTGTEQQAGIYQAGYTLIVRYADIILNALALEFYPRIVKVADRGRMASVMVSHELLTVLSVLTPMVVAFIALDRTGVLILYSTEFMAALPFITIGVCSLLPRAASYCLAYVVIARGDGRTYVVTDLISCAVGLALNVLMYSRYGFAGLGVSYVVWYAFYLAMMWYVCRRCGIRLNRRVVVAGAWATVLTGGALALKACGWWASLALLLPALYFTWREYRRMRPGMLRVR